MMKVIVVHALIWLIHLQMAFAVHSCFIWDVSRSCHAPQMLLPSFKVNHHRLLQPYLWLQPSRLHPDQLWRASSISVITLRRILWVPQEIMHYVLSMFVREMQSCLMDVTANKIHSSGCLMEPDKLGRTIIIPLVVFALSSVILSQLVPVVHFLCGWDVFLTHLVQLRYRFQLLTVQLSHQHLGPFHIALFLCQILTYQIMLPPVRSKFVLVRE